jgi:hypothetical protein
VLAQLKDQRTVTLVDLSCFGKPTRLAWRKRRWRRSEVDCPNGSWSEEDPSMAASRFAITGRAGR